MGESLLTQVGGPRGVGLSGPVVRLVKNKTLVTVNVGSGMQFDLTHVQAASFNMGADDSAFTVCIAPIVGQVGYGFFCAALESIVDGDFGRAVIMGNQVRLLVGPTTTVGGAIGAQASTVFTGTPAAGTKVLGVAHEVTASNAVIAATFNGFSGIAMVA